MSSVQMNLGRFEEGWGKYREQTTALHRQGTLHERRHADEMRFTCDERRDMVRHAPRNGFPVPHRHRFALRRSIADAGRTAVLRVDFEWLRNRAGGRPNSRLKARLKEGSDS